MNVNNDLQGLQPLFPSAGVGEVQGSSSSAASAPVRQEADEATLSPAASMAAQAAPESDVRMDKVAQVQQALAAGTYNVPASAVADRTMSQMMGRG